MPRGSVSAINSSNAKSPCRVKKWPCGTFPKTMFSARNILKLWTCGTLTKNSSEVENKEKWQLSNWNSSPCLPKWPYKSTSTVRICFKRCFKSLPACSSNWDTGWHPKSTDREDKKKVRTFLSSPWKCWIFGEHLGRLTIQGNFFRVPFVRGSNLCKIFKCHVSSSVTPCQMRFCNDTWCECAFVDTFVCCLRGFKFFWSNWQKPVFYYVWKAEGNRFLKEKGSLLFGGLCWVAIVSDSCCVCPNLHLFQVVFCWLVGWICCHCG